MRTSSPLREEAGREDEIEEDETEMTLKKWNRETSSREAWRNTASTN